MLVVENIMDKVLNFAHKTVASGLILMTVYAGVHVTGDAIGIGQRWYGRKQEAEKKEALATRTKE